MTVATFAPDLGWRPTPLAGPPALAACIARPGSLTDQLIATGHEFAVTVLAQGEAGAHDDEAAPLGLPAGATLYARHVALTLDGVPVVTARTVARPACAVWLPVLNRGRRSLGFTLFGGASDIVQEPLVFRLLGPRHPLFGFCRQHDPAGAETYPARRARFLRADAPLIVCEAFLPALEGFL